MANTLSVNDVAEFLKEIKLGCLVELFSDNDVDGGMLIVLSAGELRDLGIENSFHCAKIIEKFEKHLLKLINKQEQ